MRVMPAVALAPLSPAIVAAGTSLTAITFTQAFAEASGVRGSVEKQQNDECDGGQAGHNSLYVKAPERQELNPSAVSL